MHLFPFCAIFIAHTYVLAMLCASHVYRETVDEFIHSSSESSTHDTCITSVITRICSCSSFIGTMGYIPPEAMRRSSGVKVTSAVSKKWDVYSFGVLMCYTLSGISPFTGMSDPEIMVMVLLDRKRPRIPPHVDIDPQNPVFKEMIQRLWREDPLERDGFPAIVEQLHKLVAEPNLKRTVELAAERSMSRKFVRTLPTLLTGKQCMCMC